MSDNEELEPSGIHNFAQVSKEEIQLHDEAKQMIREAVHKVAYEEFNNAVDPIEIVRNWSVTMFAFDDNSLVFWAEIPGANSDMKVLVYPDYWWWRLDEMITNWQ